MSPSSQATSGAPTTADSVDASPQAKASIFAALRTFLRSYLALETQAATVTYWASAGLLAGALFVPRLLPCVDYPQHLALADIARRLADPTAPEQATYQLNYFTYNGLFHIAVAFFARVVSIELVGRAMVAASLLLVAAGALALLRVLDRPPTYAALFLPVVFSFAVAWGFVNFALGTALAVVAIALIARALIAPSVAGLIAIALVGWACAMTHVLAMLALCLFAVSLAPELSLASTQRPSDERPGAPRVRWLGRAFLRSFLALLPLIVGALWCIAVYRVQYAWDPPMYKDATLEGSAPPVWQKLVWFSAWATGLHSDNTDQVMVWTTIVFGIVATVVFLRTPAASRAKEDEGGGRRPLYLPFIAMMLAYLATPMVFIGTHLIFPRLTQGVVLAALLAMPRFPARFARPARRLALVFGLITGLNLFGHAVAYARETDDASRVIDDCPPGRRATAVIYGGDTFAFRNGPLVHMAAYYAARKHGDWAYSFGRYLSVPVRFKPGGGPPWPRVGWEFDASSYDPRCNFARLFDLVLVKAPSDVPPDNESEDWVRRLVFKQDAFNVRLVSHHGQFWAFDTRGVARDGEL